MNIISVSSLQSTLFISVSVQEKEEIGGRRRREKDMEKGACTFHVADQGLKQNIEVENGGHFIACLHFIDLCKCIIWILQI